MSLQLFYISLQIIVYVADLLLSSYSTPPHLIAHFKAAPFGTRDELIDACSAKGPSLSSSSPFQLIRSADLPGDTPLVGLDIRVSQ